MWRPCAGWPSTNAQQVATTSSWDEAHTWMQQDKANRVVEGVQLGFGIMLSDKQVQWERVDENKPIGFTVGPGNRTINFYPNAQLPGGCLYGSVRPLSGLESGRRNKYER